MNKDKLQIKNVPLFYFESIDSTNTFCRNLEIEKEALIVAETQTAGRGRVGHDFFSPRGGLYFTYAFRDNRQLGDLTVEVGKIVLNRIQEFCDPSKSKALSIHGVNDIFLDDKKICGILCEHILDKYIVGIGINASDCQFPDDLKSIAGFVSIDRPEELLISIVKDIKKVIS